MWRRYFWCGFADNQEILYLWIVGLPFWPSFFSKSGGQQRQSQDQSATTIQLVPTYKIWTYLESYSNFQSRHTDLIEIWRLKVWGRTRFGRFLPTWVGHNSQTAGRIELIFEHSALPPRTIYCKPNLRRILGGGVQLLGDLTRDDPRRSVKLFCSNGDFEMQSNSSFALLIHRYFVLS